MSDEHSSLPGWLRQLQRAARHALPTELSRYAPPPDSSGRQAAVLILFGETEGVGDLLLVQRSDGVRAHAGQPAFPGGAVDPQDTGPVAAALREATEETGLDPAGVEVFAELPALQLSVSGFEVTPVLGWWRQPSEVYPADPDEVAMVARVPVAELVEPANRLRIRHPSGHVGPAFRVHGMLVWGFTAGLLDRVLELAGWAVPWSARAEDLPADRLELSLRTAPPDTDR